MAKHYLDEGRTHTQVTALSLTSDNHKIVVLAVGSSAVVIIVLLTVWLINYITNKLIGA
jgi:hypothetical protein